MCCRSSEEAIVAGAEGRERCERGGQGDGGGVEADSVAISAMVRTWLLFSFQGVEQRRDRITKLYRAVTCLQGCLRLLQGSKGGGCCRNQGRDDGGSGRDGCG